MVVLIAVTQRDGRCSGASINTAKGSMHRLEVARMMPLAEFTEADASAMTTRIPKNRQAGACPASYTRPSRRHSLQMWKGAPRGMRNEKPWVTATTYVATAADWISARVMASRGTDQWGLLMVVDITDWVDKTPDVRGVDPFDQADVTALLSLEIVQLHEPNPEDAPEPRSLLQDDDTPPWEGASEIEEE